MGKKKDESIDDILGEESQEDRKAAKSARLKALASTSKGANVKAKKEEVEKEDAKPSRASKDGKGKPVKEEKKAKGKSKSDKKEAAPRGEGKYFYDPDEKAAVMAKLLKLKKPTSTRDYAEANEIESFKVRLAATALRREGKLKIKKEGNTITMHPV